MKCKVCDKDVDYDVIYLGMCGECFKDCDCAGLEKLE